MKKRTPWYLYLIAYLLYALSLAGGLWLLLRARAVYPVLVAVLSNETEFNTRMIAQFADRAVVFGIGIALVILIVVAEHFLRTGAQKGRLWYYAARLFGILLLLLGITEAAEIIVVLNGLAVPALRWLVMLAELIGGIALLVYGARKPPARPVLGV